MPLACRMPALPLQRHAASEEQVAAAEALVLGMKVRCLRCVKAAGPWVLGQENAACTCRQPAGLLTAGISLLSLIAAGRGVRPCPHTHTPAAFQLAMYRVCLLSGSSQLGEDFHPALIQNPVLQRHYTVRCCRRGRMCSRWGAMEGRRLPGSCLRSMARRAAGAGMHFPVGQG